MSIVRAQVASVEALASWMQENAVPNIFKAVAYTDSVLTATDADDNVVFELNGGNGAGNSGFFRAYRAANNSLGFALNLFPVSTMIDIIGCENGFIFEAHVRNSTGAERLFACLISKTNDTEPAIVFPSTPPSTSSSPQQYTTGLHHVAFGDSATMSTTTTFTPETAQQTTLCPFGTNADVGTASYTTDAYYMPMGQNYNSGMAQFSIGNDHFITNGYWAIRTGGDE